MKNILEWVHQYLKNLPPRSSYSFNPGGIEGGSAIYPLDVYGTEGTKPVKTGVPSNKKRVEDPIKKAIAIEKALQYLRDHPYRP